ncbi:MAG: EVE domain-containing protein [Gammaproteobacteria bacterium]|nr:EVE domain-containing protein [Gammaproteobacteria bacterium]NVK86637.1 EVE domain-containing protein [Gammaproteobacteria bacterium]
MNYWLMKSEPDTFSIEHLKQRRNQTEHWDGVRNYQVRNMLRDDFNVGDQALFYHSSCPVPAAVGIVTITRAGYPDHTAFDPNSPYFDAKSSAENPRWFMVDVQYTQTFPKPVTLKAMKANPELLASDFALLRKGSRLSIMPVTATQWSIILSMANAQHKQ